MIETPRRRCPRSADSTAPQPAPSARAAVPWPPARQPEPALALAPSPPSTLPPAAPILRLTGPLHQRQKLKDKEPTTHTTDNELKLCWTPLVDGKLRSPDGEGTAVTAEGLSGEEPLAAEGPGWRDWGAETLEQRPEAGRRHQSYHTVCISASRIYSTTCQCAVCECITFFFPLLKLVM